MPRTLDEIPLQKKKKTQVAYCAPVNYTLQGYIVMDLQPNG